MRLERFANAVFLWLLVCGSVQAVWSAPAKPRTVIDYYYLLPSTHFQEPPNDTDSSLTRRQYRELNLKANGLLRKNVVDVKNDYIYVGSGDSQPALAIAVFRHGGRELVAVLNYGYDPAIPSLYFYRYTSSGWNDVTRQYLPAKFNENVVYTLPRYGTTVKVQTKAGRPVSRWIWRNGKFNIQ